MFGSDFKAQHIRFFFFYRRGHIFSCIKDKGKHYQNQTHYPENLFKRTFEQIENLKNYLRK